VGYTLEAMLGVSANARNEPDFEGYEVKAMTVPAFGRETRKAVTLFTPEPDLGIYQTQGVIEFINRWGYPDRNGIPDRRNFGGVHRANCKHNLTNLTLKVEGYSLEIPDKFDPSGVVALRSDAEDLAAGWSFHKFASTWTRKHSSAVYVPAMKEKCGDKVRFMYGPAILICEGTHLLRFFRVC
jgi:hypothetical protein